MFEGRVKGFVAGSVDVELREQIRRADGEWTSGSGEEVFFL